MSQTWHPASWQTQKISQLPQYPNSSELNGVKAELTRLPPLVTAFEIEKLKSELAQAAKGERFVLQGGDCAESFSECSTENITNKIKILLQMSLVLVHGLRCPLIRIGRLAGQFAKPRSENEETRDGVTLPSYRGDLINGQDFSKNSRLPDPNRMKQGYSQSAATLNYVRSLVSCGFADLHHPEHWDLGFMEHSPMCEEYQSIVKEIKNSLAFLSSVAGIDDASLKRVDFFTSHEALLLHYEEALTREIDGRWYNTSTHLPWVGMRTAFEGSAHVEFLSGIANPVAMKVGPELDRSTLQRLIQQLNPKNEPGKLTLIHRFGVQTIAEKLPDMIKAVQDTQKSVLWISDPMHGNTVRTSGGIKTRRYEDILSELEQAFEVHEAHNSLLGGVHLELTGENVTECLGGARDLQEADLAHAYKTLVDPRLNYEQALEASMRIVRKIR